MTGHAPLIDVLNLPDKDDRHVLAAAIKCSAQLIVTENRKDFPDEILKCYNIESIGADDFLADTFELFPRASESALETVRNRYKRPPFTRSEFIMNLRNNKLPRIAEKARSAYK